MKVDLPQPDGPMRAVTVLASATRLMSSRTRCDPNQAWTPEALRVWPSAASVERVVALARVIQGLLGWIGIADGAAGGRSGRRRRSGRGRRG